LIHFYKRNQKLPVLKCDLIFLHQNPRYWP